MCLSTLYEGKIDPGNVIMEDAAHVTIKNGKIVIMDILGDEKELNGYEIEDLDFMKHYAVLKKVSEE
jgi:predicted RNA-binding protein